MRFGYGCGEDVKGGGLACSVGSEQTKGLSAIDEEGVISDGYVSVGILLIECVDENGFGLIQPSYFLFLLEQIFRFVESHLFLL
jgi:hypothetical protein